MTDDEYLFAQRVTNAVKSKRIPYRDGYVALGLLNLDLLTTQKHRSIKQSYLCTMLGVPKTSLYESMTRLTAAGLIATDDDGAIKLINTDEPATTENTSPN